MEPRPIRVKAVSPSTSAARQSDAARSAGKEHIIASTTAAGALALAVSALAACGTPINISITVGEAEPTNPAPGAGAVDGPVINARSTPIAISTEVVTSDPNYDDFTPAPPESPGLICSFEKQSDGRTIIPQASLDTLDSLKQNGFPVDQWNQWAEVGTFDGAEVTAGDNRQAFVALDLWRRDGKTPWGNAEVKTIVRWGVKPNSIGLKDGFSGTGWVYPQDIQGKGWNNQLVACDSAAGVGRRIAAGENIADAMVVPYNDGQYILVNGAGQPLVQNGRAAWTGNIDTRDANIVGIRGIVPLQVLVDLGLAVDRHP